MSDLADMPVRQHARIVETLKRDDPQQSENHVTSPE
jgi:hypothetical protein